MEIEPLYPAEMNCYDCAYLGRYEESDLYYCKQLHGESSSPVVRAVNPSKFDVGEIVTSDIKKAEEHPILEVALKRAIRMGFNFPK